MKRLVLCADDYGQNAGVSQAIVSLLERGRLTATSCMTNSPFWGEQAQWLTPFKTTADIGLHFNLTTGLPLSKELNRLFSLSELIVRAHLRILPKSAIKAELKAQLDAFVKVLGQYPHYIDGHQHVHQFPIIRDCLLEIYEEKKLNRQSLYFRCTNNPNTFKRYLEPDFIKKVGLELLGGFAFKNILDQYLIPHNTSFSGIYDFRREYRVTFNTFLAESRDNGIIMCHPSMSVEGSSDDTIAAARLVEFQFLQSEEFIDALQNADVKLMRFDRR